MKTEPLSPPLPQMPRIPGIVNCDHCGQPHKAFRYQNGRILTLARKNAPKAKMGPAGECWWPGYSRGTFQATMDMEDLACR